MSSILAITGMDLTGKSTLVQELSKQLGYKTKHFDKPKDKEDAKQSYFNFLKEIQQSNENFILDRFHEGEWIYAPKLRGYTGDYLKEIESEIINNHPFLYVYVKASLPTILKRAEIRGEDFINKEDFQYFLDAFESFMNMQNLPFIEIDTTNSKTESDVERIISAFDKINTIWDLVKSGSAQNVILKPVQPRGNIEADIMIVAQNPGGKGEGNYSTVWSEGKNSKFLLGTVKEAGIFNNTWFTNLVPYPTEDNKVTKEQIEVTEHILYTQIELIKPKVLVGLGNTAYGNLERLFGEDIPIMKLQHPSYITRFGNNNDKTDYVDKLKEVKKYL